MRRILKILILSSFFINLAAGLFGPIYAIFVEEIGGDLLTAGTAYAIFAIASGSLIFMLGKWEDKVKHQEKLLVFGRFLAVIGFIGYLLIKNPTQLFIVQIIFGIESAIITPAFDSLFSKNLNRKKFASQWGTWESTAAITTGIAAIIGGYIAKEYGFQTLFTIMLIISIFSFLVTLLLIKRIREMLRK